MTTKEGALFTEAFNIPGQSVTWPRLCCFPFDLKPALRSRLVKRCQEHPWSKRITRKRRRRGRRWGWIGHTPHGPERVGPVSEGSGPVGSRALVCVWVEIWVYQRPDPCFDGQVAIFYLQSADISLEKMPCFLCVPVSVTGPSPISNRHSTVGSSNSRRRSGGQWTLSRIL